ncbi:sugar transferase [Microbacterium sp. NPDC057659]|uniref:sugar transferase n=1 Tax=Microbacterium sp. NPDC057659 TaxID=3346198 RepID=UPI00366A9EDE
MTSVEDAVSVAQVGSVHMRLAASPSLRVSVPTISLPETTAASADALPVVQASVAPRASATLEHRLMWERRYRRRLGLTDAVVLVTASSATAISSMLTGGSVAGVLLLSMLLMATWFALLSGLHTRQAALFRTSISEYRGVVHATGLAFGFMAIVAVGLRLPDMQTTMLVALPGGLFALLITRWSWRRWLTGQRSLGRLASRTLVVGNRVDVEYVLDRLSPIEQSGYLVLGATLLDGNATELEVHGTRFPVLGNVNTVSDVAAQLGADTIVVASRPDGDPDFIKRLSWQLEGTAAQLVLSNPLTDVVGPRMTFSPIDGLPLIQVEMPSYEGGRHVLKRALDIVVATAALIPIALITPFLGLLIKLDNHGPVFFFQERVGRDGRTFKMVKFRSMRTDAEAQLAALKEQNEGAGVLFKMKDDPRVTRVGRVLRKLSLDELPQFWNVLTGDMSVVGPRPPLRSEVDAYEQIVHRRLYLKPGITGLWQVSGRSDLSWDESVRLDLRYIENWSVLGDLQIMWRTAKVMIQPSGAY